MSAEVADVLDKAAEVIETRGWVQGVMGTPDGCRCVWGGVGKALEELNPAAHEEDAFPETEAMTALGAHLGLFDRDDGPAQWATALPQWNDAPGRTAHEVIAALRNAAAAERAS